MRNQGWFVATALLGLASACSPFAAIDKMAGEKYKHLAFELTDQICAQDRVALKARFDPELWTKSESQLAAALPYCPQGPSQKRLVGYFWKGNTGTSGSNSQRSLTVATKDQSRWTMTTFVLASNDGGPERVVQWNINATREKPAELAQLDDVEDALPVLRWIVAALILGIGAIVLWLVRRHRRKASAAKL